MCTVACSGHVDDLRGRNYGDHTRRADALRREQVLRAFKQGLVTVARRTGVSTLLLDSEWRRQRLLILCYHGISVDDEHEWHPALFMPPTLLRRRFETLVQHRCSVLPLEEAVQRLYLGDLPPRSVAITFDDGMADFHSLAVPILREFGFPATVYLSTYYSHFNRPVFDVMCSYLLWKARGRRFTFPGVLEGDVDLSGVSPFDVAGRLRAFAYEQRMSALEKDTLLTRLASHLEIDYEAICRKRLLHLMNTGEARAVASETIQIQLHTHRHRISNNRNDFEREIVENRRHIAAITPIPARHFCYPSGFYQKPFPEWLREMGIATATTCDSGLATRRSDVLLLPRFVDSTTTTDAEFISWISGVAVGIRRLAPPMPLCAVGAAGRA